MIDASEIIEIVKRLSWVILCQYFMNNGKGATIHFCSLQQKRLIVNMIVSFLF